VVSERSKGVLLAVLVAIAAGVWYVSTRGPSAVANTSPDAAATYHPLAVDNPELQRDKLKKSRDTEYKGTGRDLFSELAPPPPEADKPRDVAQTPVGPVVPPTPPPPALPSNVKFFGYGTIPNGTARRAFLSDGDQVYIVGEGDTLLGRFRVLKIGNANLDFEEIASGRRGTAALSDEPAVAPST
jgi:hypothetical protein